MKNLLFGILLVFYCAFGLAQESASYKKIYFTYDAKTNYIETKDGFFADTMLIKMDFPNLKYRLVAKPDNPEMMVGYVAFNDISSEGKRRFKGILAHHDETMEGVYDIRTKKTVVKHKRSRMKFKWNTKIDYETQIVQVNYSLVSYERKFDIVVFDDDSKRSGTYSKTDGKWRFTNVVIFDESLDKSVAAVDIFSNSEFGIKKLITLHRTIELTSVSYK